MKLSNPFKRNRKVDSSLPPEVQAYAQAEHRERMGMAWLVGIVSLIISLLLVTGLFFGGRWAYRKLSRQDKPVPVVTENNDNKDNGRNNDQNKDDDTPATDTPSSGGSNTPSTPQTDLPGGEDEAQTPTQQPVTGDTSELPNTGPTEDN